MPRRNESAKGRRERFLAEALVDFANFENLPNLRETLADFTRSLYPAREVPDGVTNPLPSSLGSREKNPPFCSTGGPLTVATAFDDELSPDSECPQETHPRAAGEVEPFHLGPGQTRYRVDSPHVDEELLFLRAHYYYESVDDYLAEVRMSGDGDGDVLLTPPEMPSQPRPRDGAAHPHISPPGSGKNVAPRPISEDA